MIARVILLWLAAPLIALGLAVVLLDPPAEDLRLLAQFLVSSEVLSLALAGLAWRLMRALRLGGIQAKIGLTYALGVAIVLINIALSSMPMFFSGHDSALLVVLLLFGALVALGFGWVMARSVTRGLAGLASATTAVAAGDLGRRVELATGDEVEEVGRAFNAMGERLADAQRREAAALRSQRSLIASASHDLRTPLTSLRATVEALREGVVEDGAETGRYLDVALSEIQHLGRLVDDLFELTQLHAGVLQARREVASLHDLVSDTIQALRLPSQEVGVVLEGEVAANVDPVWIDPYLMQRALTNLVENAIRHTPRGGTVRVVAARQGQVELRVHDGGEGIPEDELPHIFEAFFRGESSRTRDRGEGAGLGLSIARAVVEAHGGSISADPGPGAVFRIRFPATSPDGALATG